MGSKIKDSNLTQRKIRANNNTFKNPLFTEFSNGKNEIYNDVVNLNLNADFIYSETEKRKNTNIKDQNHGFDTLYTSKTTFENNLGKDKGVRFLEFNFDWHVQKMDELDRLEVAINPEDANIILELNSEASIRIKKENEIKVIKESSKNSIGNIANIIDNNLNSFNAQFFLHKNKLKIKIYKSGYESIWYSFDFSDFSIKELEVRRICENRTGNRTINSKFTMHDLFLGGYDEGYIYKSEIIDSGFKGSSFEGLTLSSVFGKELLYPETKTIKDNINIKLYSSDRKSKLLEKIDNEKADKEISLEKSFGKYTEDLEINDIKGRFILLEISLGEAKEVRNNIEYIRLKYLAPEDIKEPLKYKDIEEKSISKKIDSNGGVINLKDESFSVRLFIPPDALSQETEIVLTRLSGKDPLLPEDFIGVELKPLGLRFGEPALLEIDYDGYKFDEFQSEEYLNLCYLSDELERLKTRVFTDRKVATAYIEEIRGSNDVGDSG